MILHGDRKGRVGPFRHQHGDRKGPPNPTPPPSPLLYYEGVSRCRVFDERPMQCHTLIHIGKETGGEARV